MKKCIIIGGGVGGLFTGAFLSKNGYEVTVLEKNTIIGGGLQCFSRNGKIYETGMHVIGGFEPGGSLYKICRYLGILDSLKIEHIRRDCMDEIYFHQTGERFEIASGRDGFAESLAGYFPDEREALKDYVDALYRITEEVPMFYLREEQIWQGEHSAEFLMPADQLIAKYISDEHLQEVLAYLNPLYGGMKGHTPAYIHAVLNVLYINGSSRFIAGSQQLADLLKEMIECYGGRVLCGKEVTSIDVADKSVNFVETSDGQRYEGDCFVSSIHPAQMMKIVSKGTFRRFFVKRINEIPNSYSAFSLYIDLKPNTFRYIDHTCYYMEQYGHIWAQNESDNAWPHGFMYMTPPDEGQGEYASRLLVHCAMDFSQVSSWINTSVGKRGDDYLRWKAEQTTKIIDKLENLFPGFSENIEHVYSASPLTIRDYYNTKDGSIFGYRKDCNNYIYSQLPVYTKVSNLFLTGQNINLHGICGVPLTAVNTAEAIVGRNVIIKAINHESLSN